MLKDGRLLAWAIAAAAFAILLLLVAWTGATFWPESAPPLRQIGLVNISPEVVRVGEEIISGGTICNDSDEPIVARFEPTWESVQNSHTRRVPAAGGIFSVQPGCTFLSSAITVPNLAVGTWHRTGLLMYDHAGKERELSYLTENFEVVE